MLPDHHALLFNSVDFDLELVRSVHKSESPDLYRLQVDTVSISDVRSLITIAWQKPIQDTVRTILVDATTIATEAQHALLKILEEPPATTHFILVLQNPDNLLPTLLSRLHKVTGEVKINDAAENISFVSLPISEQLEMIAAKTKNKDSQWLETVYKELVTVAGTTTNMNSKKALLTTLQYFNQRGASKKMLLEGAVLALSR